MNQVLSKINTRFDSSEYILELFGEAVQEETFLKEAAIECFTDSIDLIIEKLTLVDRQKFLINCAVSFMIRNNLRTSMNSEQMWFNSSFR
jgi:hypothetical protein